MSKMLRMSAAQHDEWKSREASRAANEPPPLKLKPVVVPEAAVIDVVLKALLLHRKVETAWRVNSGAFVVPATETTARRFVRFGFPGCPDIHGVLRGGRAIFVECKRVGEEAKPDQAAFLARMRAAGCLAFVARNFDDVMRELAAA